MRVHRSESFLAVALLLAVAGGCDTFEPQPPTPPPPAQVGPEAFGERPLDPNGRPGIVEVPAGNGYTARVVYDDSVDDPLRRWSECLDRVAACYTVNGGRIDGCVDFIELCDDPAGGFGCCPAACIEDFHSARASGLDETAAVDRSFVLGACIVGFQDQVAAAGVGEVSP